MGDEDVMPVMDIDEAEGIEDDNFLLVFGVILVMDEEPACCIVSPKAEDFCCIGVTDIPCEGDIICWSCLVVGDI